MLLRNYCVNHINKQDFTTIKLKITITRMRLAFIAAFFIVAIFLFATYSNMNKAESESRNVKSALDVLLRLENILVDIEAIESGQRGFTISGDEKFLDPYNLGLKSIRQDISILAQLELTDSTKFEERTKLISLLNEKIAVSKFIVKAGRIHGFDSAAISRQAMSGKLLMDSITETINTIQNKDQILLQEFNVNREKYAKRSVWEFFVLAFIFSLLLYFCYKTILKEFRQLIKNEKVLGFNSSLIRNISDPIITTDVNNNITKWNLYAEKLYGHKEEEVIGKKIDLLLNITGNQASQADILQTDYWKSEAIHHHKTGHPINVEISTSAIKGDAGENLGIVAVIRDITQRKSMECQLQQLTANLQQQVNAKVAELKNVFERIEYAFIALDNQWNYTYVNAKAAKLPQN